MSTGSGELQASQRGAALRQTQTRLVRLVPWSRGVWLSLGLLAAASLGGGSGCVSDSECGICDPHRLVLQSLSGPNYRGERVHRLSEGVSEGRYFVEDIVDCLETPEAIGSERGAEEYCKLSPLITAEGLEFVFNNLLEPSSIEGLRRDPSAPERYEVYDWKVGIASIEGPSTRFNGDLDVVGSGALSVRSFRSVNLTCIDNLRGEGIDFDAAVLADDPEICEGMFEDEGSLLPRRLDPQGVTRSFRGQTDWREGSCVAPEDGPDTCCSVCDYASSVDVARYGATTQTVPRSRLAAIDCDLGAVYESCAGFVPLVDRSAEVNRYVYEWEGVSDAWRVPLVDRIRETHPDARPDGLAPGPPCTASGECGEGRACIGEGPGGVACDASLPGCGGGSCEPEWFVRCAYVSENDVGPVCVDSRFEARGAGACRESLSAFWSCGSEAGSCEMVEAGGRLALCDGGVFPDGLLSEEECCQSELGAVDDVPCDPLELPQVVPVSRFDRRADLPRTARACHCGDPALQPSDCAALVEERCTAPWGSLVRHDGESNEGHYIDRFVTQAGGVVYDPALKSVLYLPADLGTTRRALVERCSEQQDNIGELSELDGWRWHDGGVVETRENFDRGLCSASDYTVVFATEGEQVVDKVGNTLGSSVPVSAQAPRLRYPFSTPEFHVVPDSGAPAELMTISPCDRFSLRLSNKYDLSPRNLRKLELVALARRPGGAVDDAGESCGESQAPECWVPSYVAGGGLDCAGEVEAVSEGSPPCLDVDVAGQPEGELIVAIDLPGLGPVLSEASEALDVYGRPRTGRYRLRAPGLEGFDSWAELEAVLSGGEPEAQATARAAYAAAFHDVCGMPLITAGASGFGDFYYDFSIDPPSCGHDRDGDGVPVVCDNALDFPNPDQRDEDRDGIGDVVDRCPYGGSYDSDPGNFDKDGDGLAQACDSCGDGVSDYNYGRNEPGDSRLLVRNNPQQGDFDGDGIGDVCDNCPALANCGDFGQGQVHHFGDPGPYGESALCQRDDDLDMIGDACQVGAEPGEGVQISTHAAGVIGFANDDDFDQDGLSNLLDHCPRIPVQTQTCSADEPCALGASCSHPEGGVCNHVDSDGDLVGDRCDTCPDVFNPIQITEGGMQLDDPDEDFVGELCEGGQECGEINSPRPFGFMQIAVEGRCCATSYPGDGQYVVAEDGSWGCEGLCDPDGFPVVEGCADERLAGVDVPDGSKCRRLPSDVAASVGVLELPPGCADALADAGLCDPNDPDCPGSLANPTFTLNTVASVDAIWGQMCWLPVWDQDFDGLSDACDLCPLAFDPANIERDTFTIGSLGYYCSGDYGWAALCEGQEPEDEDSETETGPPGG